MPKATADDVRLEIDTVLEDSTIEGADGDADDDGLLGRIEREWRREYDEDRFDGTAHIRDFEAVLTALRIAEGLDRRADTAQSGRTSTTYETSEIENLRKRLRRLDPGDEFGHSGQIVRRDSRHTTSTGDH